MRNQKLKQLEDIRIQLFKELDNLSKEKLNASLDGDWSINQILYHTWVAESSSIKYIQTKYSQNKPCDEVLGAAQFTERTMHQCQKMSKVVISCHKLS